MASTMNLPSLAAQQHHSSRLAVAALAVALVSCSNSDDSASGPPLDCDPPEPTRPVVAQPLIGETEYTIELSRWGVSSDGTNADETTDGLNEALAWAASQGYGKVHLPAGTYLVGKMDGTYVAGIELQSNMALILDDAAVIQLVTSDAQAYCVVAVTAKHDVSIQGGSIRGDRLDHDYSKGGEEGHCICVQNESERVVVDGLHLSEPIGDGVLIVAQGEKGSSCTDVTVRNCTIEHGRRQGISIVGGARVLVENNEIQRIEGTAPQFGIDIESMSYKSYDIVIRKNSFHHNRGGDIVNCDGKNVWIEENTMSQGDDTKQTDGPMVYWKNTDNVVRGNVITVTTGGSNGKYGIVGYSNDHPRTNPAANRVEGNTLTGGGILMYKDSLLHLKANDVSGGWILGDAVSCLRLYDNEVTVSGETFKFREVRGRASGNIANGAPIDLPMTDDAPYTNSPPNLW
jgi:mannuronan 5-epimerase